MALPQSYLGAILTLGRVFEAYRQQTGHDAVLVGGGAVTLYTDGTFLSGDFDVVAASDAAFDAAMVAHGFVREDRVGRFRVGYYHPDHLQYGFQQVTGPLFDGRSDRAHLVRVEVAEDSAVVLPSVEDMIADRLAQHAAASPTDTSRLDQARELFAMAESPDTDYLFRRVLDEGGDPTLLGIAGLEERKP